ncbi:MAG: endonuclease [Bacteroidetes bacterium HGW-Bacteroidetes-22]|nr:MAG: endonuclease [Bacteroidetes bacterium HGW-Bacteroidetes-22]
MSRLFAVVAFFFFFSTKVAAQNATAQSTAMRSPVIRVMFYNFENLFDPEDDSLTNDEEFTPTGVRYYTKTRMYTKINNIARVILALGEGNLPAIIGGCEIENREVLEKLVSFSQLHNFHYEIIHYNSPDSRGIDVGMLYRPELYNPCYSCPLPVMYDSSGLRRARDILYVKGVLPGGDTLHCFVNHWPSRYGGVQSTIIRRQQAALVVKRFADSLQRVQPGVQIIVMGDLNDDPDDPSVREALQAVSPEMVEEMSDGSFVSLMWECLKPGAEGTLKYQNHWNVFDQMLVPACMVKGTSPWQVRNSKAEVFRGDFLFVPDETWGGRKLFRTYVGFRYTGGYSDHLPIYLDLIRGK